MESMSPFSDCMESFLKSFEEVPALEESSWKKSQSFQDPSLPPIMTSDSASRPHVSLAKRKALLRSHMASGLHVDIPESYASRGLWDHSASCRSPRPSSCLALPWTSPESDLTFHSSWGFLDRQDSLTDYRHIESPRYSDLSDSHGLRRRGKLPIHRRISTNSSCHPNSTHSPLAGGQNALNSSLSDSCLAPRKTEMGSSVMYTSGHPSAPRGQASGMYDGHAQHVPAHQLNVPKAEHAEEGMGEVGELQGFTNTQVLDAAQELLREVCRYPTPPRGRRGGRGASRWLHRRKRQALIGGVSGSFSVQSGLSSLGDNSRLLMGRSGGGMGSARPMLQLPHMMPLPLGGTREQAMKLRALVSQAHASYKMYNEAVSDVVRSFDDAVQRPKASEGYTKPVATSVSVAYRRLCDSINQQLSDLAL